MAEPRPQIPYFKEFLPTPVCIGLSLFFAMVFQFNGGVFLPAATQMSSALGCIQDSLRLLHWYDRYISDTVPSEIPVYHPIYFHDGMPGTRSLQPDYHAYRQHLSYDLCMLRIGILPHVGYL